MTIYLDDNNEIHYSIYRKKTDSRQFLNTESFHPVDVFKSVSFSQMLRVISRNSRDETMVSDLDELKQDLVRCGHRENKLEEIEPKAVLRNMTNQADKKRKRDTEAAKESLVFTTKYYQEVAQAKTFIRKLEPDIRRVAGDVRIIFALQKNESVQQRVVKNRALSLGTSGQGSVTKPGQRKTQACGATSCKTCPMMADLHEPMVVNGVKVSLDPKLTCKSKNVIYLAQCAVCQQKRTTMAADFHTIIDNVVVEDSYVGQTVSEARVRMNGHRSAFKCNGKGEYVAHRKSALAQHCHEQHVEHMSLSSFKLGLIKSCSAAELDREENRFICKLRTEVIGLNRIKVVR